MWQFVRVSNGHNAAPPGHRSSAPCGLLNLLPLLLLLTQSVSPPQRSEGGITLATNSAAAPRVTATGRASIPGSASAARALRSEGTELQHIWLTSGSMQITAQLGRNTKRSVVLWRGCNTTAGIGITASYKKRLATNNGPWMTRKTSRPRASNAYCQHRESANLSQHTCQPGIPG